MSVSDRADVFDEEQRVLIVAIGGLLEGDEHSIVHRCAEDGVNGENTGGMGGMGGMGELGLGVGGIE